MKRFFNLFGKIKSFEIVTLHTSGLRRVTDYEIVMNGDEAEVSQYAVGSKKHGFDTVSKQYDMIKAKNHSILWR